MMELATECWIPTERRWPAATARAVTRATSRTSFLPFGTANRFDRKSKKARRALSSAIWATSPTAPPIRFISIRHPDGFKTIDWRRSFGNGNTEADGVPASDPARTDRESYKLRLELYFRSGEACRILSPL